MIIRKLFVIIMIIQELFEIIFNYLNLQMNYAPNFELRTGSCFKFPIAWWWRSVYISSNLFCWRLHEVWRSVHIRSNLFCSRLHGVPSDVLLVLWWRNARDVSNSDLQWSHLKGRNCWVDTLWLFCLFIDGILSDSSAYSLHCMQDFQRYSRKLSRREQERASEIPSPTSHIALKYQPTDDAWIWNVDLATTHGNSFLAKRKIRKSEKKQFRTQLILNFQCKLCKWYHHWVVCWADGWKSDWKSHFRNRCGIFFIRTRAQRTYYEEALTMPSVVRLLGLW